MTTPATDKVHGEKAMELVLDWARPNHQHVLFNIFSSSNEATSFVAPC